LEAVLLSVPQTFINLNLKEGKSYARDLETLKKDVDKPLIAILTFKYHCPHRGRYFSRGSGKSGLC